MTLVLFIFVNFMEVELLWRRPNAPSVALCRGLRFLRLSDITEQLLAGHKSGS